MLTIANRARTPVRCELAWLLGADYADIQEALADLRGGSVPFYDPGKGFTVRAGLDLPFHRGQ